MRDGLNAFSLAGPLGRFLDADQDVLLEQRFITFELETLMAMGPKVIVPVVTYLFHRIDQRLDGRPSLIILDEAWIMLADSSFGAKIEEWLRTLRKKNAAVVLATQSLAEIANSPHRDVILESCPTKLYLPNPEAENAATRDMYRRFGLNDRQIENRRRSDAQAPLLLRLAARTAIVPVLTRPVRSGVYRRGLEGRYSFRPPHDTRARR